MRRIYPTRTLAVLVASVLALAACGQAENEAGGVLANGELAVSVSAQSPANTVDQSTSTLVSVQPTPAEVAELVGLPVTSDAFTSTLNQETTVSAPVDPTTTSVAESSSTTQPPATKAPTTKAPTTKAPASSTQPTSTQPSASQPATTAGSSGGRGALTYKVMIATGDDSIDAFDNARKKIKDLFTARGVSSGNVIELSRMASQQTNGVRATSVQAIDQAMSDLGVGDSDACVAFLTSHGSRQQWAIRGSNGLTPQRLDQILTDGCGNRPTIALVSACYSGIFVDPMARANRVILTAASPVNTSFGCSAEATYTYWDGCFIQQFPAATTWEDLYSKVTGCIETKEASAGVTPSRPQAHFGSEVSNMAIFGN